MGGVEKQGEEGEGRDKGKGGKGGHGGVRDNAVATQIAGGGVRGRGGGDGKEGGRGEEGEVRGVDRKEEGDCDAGFDLANILKSPLCSGFI